MCNYSISVKALPFVKVNKKIPSPSTTNTVSLYYFELPHIYRRTIDSPVQTTISSPTPQLGPRMSHKNRRIKRSEDFLRRKQAHPLEQVHRLSDNVQPNDQDPVSLKYSPSKSLRPVNYISNKPLTRTRSRRNGIKKMDFLLSISSTLTQKGCRQVNRKTQRYATRLMRRLRRPDYLRHHHATISSSSDGNDCDLTWVVDNGSCRHFFDVCSYFSSMTRGNQLGIVSGINCSIE